MTGENGKRGSCLCGAVKVVVTSMNPSVGACHCSICRKWGGGPMFAVECGGDVHFEGDDSISIFSSSDWAERGFCSRCGTHLFYRLKDEEFYAIPPGLFGDGGEWVFDHQVFVDEKPSFYTFANDTKNLTGAEVFAQYTGSSE